jgi:phage baseplate assembly protein V
MPDSATLPADTNRRVESVVRLGVISAVDPATGRCRVKTGGLETAWLPWLERRAGTTGDWDPPTPGEQCLLLSPSGEPAAGIVLTGVPSDAHPQPLHDPNKTQRRYPDGSTVEHDHGGSRYRIDIATAGSITLVIGSSTLVLTNTGATLTTPQLTVDAPVSLFNGSVAINGGLTVSGGAGGPGNATFNGTLRTTGDIVAGTVSLQNHVHGGIQPGGGKTDKPDA